MVVGHGNKYSKHFYYTFMYFSAFFLKYFLGSDTICESSFLLFDMKKPSKNCFNCSLWMDSFLMIYSHIFQVFFFGWKICMLKTIFLWKVFFSLFEFSMLQWNSFMQDNVKINAFISFCFDLMVALCLQFFFFMEVGWVKLMVWLKMMWCGLHRLGFLRALTFLM